MLTIQPTVRQRRGEESTPIAGGQKSFRELEKYLVRYAASQSYLRPAEIMDIRSIVTGPWQRLLIIPAYAETLTSLLGVTSAFQSSGAGETVSAAGYVLQIWVVNAPEHGDPGLVSRTQQLLKALAKDGNVLWQNASHTLLKLQGRWVWVVDCATEGRRLPQSKGVGLARKIGADLGCTLLASGLLETDWFHFTDADTELPEDYWRQADAVHTTTEDAAQTSALVYAHQHTLEGDGQQQVSIRKYQKKLDLHLRGLRKAGSPYAYYTIGSTIACRPASYVQVRGVPARSAGEDFYFLNKLAKVGKVVSLQKTPLRVRGRTSRRVPFGTGPAIQAAMQSKDQSGSVLQYHPACYLLLGSFLGAVDEVYLSLEEGCDWLEAWQQALVKELIKHLQEVDEEMPGTGQGPEREPTSAALVNKLFLDFRIEEHVAKLFAHSRDLAAFSRHFHQWFDAFRTLKFIHWWRQHGFTDQPIDVAHPSVSFGDAYDDD